MLNLIFRLVEKESDLSDESKSFAPEMTHQIYGENEVVFGYKVIHFKWLLLFQYGFETDNIISPGLEPVLSNTEKYCIRSYYRQFQENLNKILKINTSFVTPASGFNLIIFHFHIHGKLSIIRCDNSYFSHRIIKSFLRI